MYSHRIISQELKEGGLRWEQDVEDYTFRKSRLLLAVSLGPASEYNCPKPGRLCYVWSNISLEPSIYIYIYIYK